ncbi:MAG: two-component regulator propeller domain-containing protein, partial [Kiritimatiellia bacterium]
MNRTALLFLACLLLARAVPAEPRTRIHQGYVITEWAVEDGLLDNDVQSLCQDRDGFVWIGTHRGLMRFDGEDFKPWPLMTGRQSLKRSVWSLLALPEGGLALAGDEPGRGVFLLSDNLRAAPVQRLPGTPSLLFRSLFHGRDRTIWAARWDSAWMRVGDGQVDYLAEMGREANTWPCSLAV